MSPTEKQPELKPCPFCGGDDIRLTEDARDHGYMFCDSCFARGPTQDQVGDWTRPHSAWNTRSLTAAEAQEVKPAGLSPWQGWDQGRDDWARTKHQDRVCNAVFGPAWSMEDAHELISFIDRTWGGGA